MLVLMLLQTIIEVVY